MFTQFERDCALINIYFQNRPDPQQRRAVQKVTSWEKVYFVQFDWGSPRFVSKKSEFLGDFKEPAPKGIFREYCDPVTLKNADRQQRKEINNRATKKWDKQEHQRWIESQELHVRHYWAYHKYSDIEKSTEEVAVMAAFAVLGLQPFCVTAEVKKAFRELALRFHPDQGGNEEAFQFLRKAYKKALVYANDYLAVSCTSEVFCQLNH